MLTSGHGRGGRLGHGNEQSVVVSVCACACMRVCVRACVRVCVQVCMHLQDLCASLPHDFTEVREVPEKHYYRMHCLTYCLTPAQWVTLHNI